jgi:hypothetical protein
MIPPISGVPAQPDVAYPPFATARRPAAPMAPPVYGMPAQPPSMAEHPAAMAAPPVTPLAMPAAFAPASRPRSSNVTLYIILGALFVVALFLVIFFALRG